MGLTETWFTDTPSNLYSLPDQNIVVKNRLDKRGGGVALFIPSFLNFSTIQDITFINDTIESLFVEVHIPKLRNMVVGVIFKPPQSNCNEFNMYFQNLLSKPFYSK